MTSPIPLCSATAVPPGHSRGLVAETADGPLALLVVNHDGRFHAYANRCPHTGVNLEWRPDVFLDAAGEHIQCAVHGALFRLDDGYCVWGPCVGRSLRALPVAARDGTLCLEDVTGRED